MLDEDKQNEYWCAGVNTRHDNDFYSAVINEDVGRINEMAKNYGANYPIKIRDGAPGKIFWKDTAVIPLHLAASYRRVGSIRTLLAAGADADIRDQRGRSALYFVMSAWPSVQTTGAKQSSKFHASILGEQRKTEACLRLLCEHGVDISAQVEGDGCQTALHLSVRYTALAAVQILTSYGANVNALNSSGMTPLHMAAGILHEDIIVCLVRKGADINSGVEPSGHTPLHLAVVAMAINATRVGEENRGCVFELLNHGADPNVVDNAGRTALHEACTVGNQEIVELLLGYGANINMRTMSGESCLFLFLNRSTNMRNSSLFVKLLSLTSPLTLSDTNGHLPSTLTLTCFFKQRDQLLALTQQPRRLQDICKISIYQRHIQSEREELTRVLPETLYDFVFNSWENIHNISFVTDNPKSFNNIEDIPL